MGFLTEPLPPHARHFPNPSHAEQKFPSFFPVPAQLWQLHFPLQAGHVSVREFGGAFISRIPFGILVSTLRLTIPAIPARLKRARFSPRKFLPQNPRQASDLRDFRLLLRRLPSASPGAVVCLLWTARGRTVADRVRPLSPKIYHCRMLPFGIFELNLGRKVS